MYREAQSVKAICYVQGSVGPIGLSKHGRQEKRQTMRPEHRGLEDSAEERGLHLVNEEETLEGL